MCAGNTYSTALAATLSMTCVACPSNTQSVQQSDALTDCTCRPGYHGNDGTPCIECSAGTYKDQPGDVLCTSCPEDTYSTASAATSAGMCFTCPSHSSADSGSSALLDCGCVGGYYNPSLFV
jgi:hypothetical protein